MPRSDWWKTHFNDAASLGGYGLPAKTRREAASAAKLLGLRGKKEVLDLGCGAGRHALCLAALGHRVTGLDWSAALLADGERGARTSDLPARFVRGDMRALKWRGRFDAAVNLFTSFGYFETEAEDLAVLRGVRRALKPGGRFLIDTLNKKWLVSHFSPTFWQKRREGEILMAFNRLSFDAKTSRLSNRRTLYLAGGKKRETFLRFKVFELEDMSRLMEQAGLVVEKAWGGFDGRAYGRNSFRLIVRCRRPK